MKDNRCHICGAEMSHINDKMCKNFHLQKKNYYGGECTCNKFANCHDCRDAFLSNQQPINVLDEAIEWLQTMADIANDDANHRAENYVEKSVYSAKCNGFLQTKEKLEEIQQNGKQEAHTKDIGDVKKENMIFTPIRHVDGE